MKKLDDGKPVTSLKKVKLEQAKAAVRKASAKADQAQKKVESLKKKQAKKPSWCSPFRCPKGCKNRKPCCDRHKSQCTAVARRRRRNPKKGNTRRRRRNP